MLTPMLDIASFNHGNPVIGILLLPVFLAMPWVMLWIEIRSIVKGEALSTTSVVVLFLLESYALFLTWQGVFRELTLIFGIWRIWMWALLIATCLAPLILGYEANKRGWLQGLLWQRGKRRRRKKPQNV